MTSRNSVLLLLGLLAVGRPAAALEIRTYTASELGFLASSHLVLGAEEALLVDAQFTRSETEDVVRMIESSGRTLKTIFITHGRPEHYLGLEVLAARFPAARVLARRATVAAIESGGEDAIGRWQPIYLDDLPTQVVVPEAFAGGALTVDGEEILVRNFAGPQGDRPTVLYVAGERTLLASDLAPGGVHLWLAGVKPAEWLGSWAAARRLGPIERVCPGHGAPGGGELLAESERYLAILETALAESASDSEVVRALKEAFPEYRLPILLEQSVKAVRGRQGG